MLNKNFLIIQKKFKKIVNFNFSPKNFQNHFIIPNGLTLKIKVVQTIENICALKNFYLVDKPEICFINI